MGHRKQKYVQPLNEFEKVFLKPLNPKNYGQEQYINALLENKICFCVGPAGTGKTFIASYIALQKLFDNEVEKIIITRPIIATEDIGYLPGTLEEKIHPYLLPLLDAFNHHIGVTKTKQFLEQGIIEVAPLAFMRGRTLNNVFAILDEGQNVTKEQMKMFLTRLGVNSYMSINGDSSQTDLDNRNDCGLIWATERLTGISEDIAIVNFLNGDIVRNPLIETILKYLDNAYTHVNPYIMDGMLNKNSTSVLCASKN